LAHLGKHLSYQRVQVCGTKRRLEIVIPFNAPPDAPTMLLLDDGSQLGDASAIVESLPNCDQYTLQGDAFSRAIRGEIELPYGVEDAVQNMRAIEAMFRSEQSGRLGECVLLSVALRNQFP
jgi:predicted dehydrogenase